MTKRLWILLLCLPLLLPAQEDLGTLLGRARVARDQGRLDDAVKDYEAMLAQVPEHETALLERAQTLSWMGRYAEALAGYKTFKELFPKRGLDADLRIAQVQAWSDNIPAALETLAPWVREGQADAVLADATYLAWQGHLAESVDRLDAWLKLHPEDRDAMMSKARFRGWMGQLKTARKDYEAVLAQYPEDGEARLGLAQLALWLGDSSEVRVQMERMNDRTRHSADGQMLEAQYEASMGRRSASTEILRRLAASGTAKRDAQDALLEQVASYGPWIEMHQSRTDSNEGLHTELPLIRTRMPLFQGFAQLEVGRSRLRFQDQERQSNIVGFSLRQNLGSNLRLAAGVRHRSDFGKEAGLAWNAGAGLKLKQGLQLQIDVAKTLLDFTPDAVDQRGNIRTVDLGLTWAFGNGLNILNLSAGRGDLSAGTHRTSYFASFERRLPLSWVELRAGLVGRSFGYSESLRLGFFNPERFRYVGLTLSAALRKTRRYQLYLNLQGGVQKVNDDPSRFARGYGISGEWMLLRSRVVLFGEWLASTAGLPVMQPLDPKEYSEHTLIFGVRLRGKAY